MSKTTTTTTSTSSSSSKSATSPLDSLFQQWSNSSTPSCSYRILLQYPSGRHVRIQAADPTTAASSLSSSDPKNPNSRPVTNPNKEVQIYQRAGIRTPSETAKRSWMGGTLWWYHLVIERLLQLSSSSSTSCNDPIHLVWIATTTSYKKWKSKLNDEINPNQMTILEMIHDPWGWDQEAKDNHDFDDNNKTKKNKDDPCIEPTKNAVHTWNKLSSLATTIQKIIAHEEQQQQQQQQQQQTNTKVVLVWESLIPLWMYHYQHQRSSFSSTVFDDENGSSYRYNYGWKGLVTWLQQFDPCLQIWSVPMDSLTSQQHSMLEDVSNAILWLQEETGEMTLLRQGIRESGNWLRETLSFELVSIRSTSGDGNVMDGIGNSGIIPTTKSSSSGHGGGFYRLVVGSNNNQGTNKDTKQEEKWEEEPIKQDPLKEKISKDDTSGAGLVIPRQRPKVGSRRAENDNSNLSAPSTISEPTNNRPRIYLQDDDPEFDDLDEEDPDDDLDL